MSERKICEYYDGNDRDIPPWWPIDPQPCCANCIQRGEENDYGNLIMCDRFHTWLRLDFYCDFWKVKE